MQNISGVEREKCCGCGACASVCPVGAISLVKLEDGFLYPEVNNEKCTNCGLCIKRCPVENTQYKNTNKPECYAYMGTNKIRSISSSGGAFATLAEYFVLNGGYVVGAVWDDDWSVKHIVSNSFDDIKRMQKSKYLQSVVGDCYKQVKDILNSGTDVLFSGTPCQIAGLNAYLNKQYDNLYCLDLICHGVPSAKIFQKYLDENFDVSTIKDIDFRSKKVGGWGVDPISINNSIQPQIKNDYMKLFLDNLIFRSSCGECPFNRITRQGDLSIGDFWGIRKFSKKFDDRLGTSVLLVNNEKGEYLLEILNSQSKLCKKVPIKYALRANPNITAPSVLHKSRDIFFNGLDSHSIRDNKDIVYGLKTDAIILNFWSSVNYGAVLTAYGVQCLFDSLGMNAKLLNYIPKTHHKNTYEGSFVQDFADKYLNLTDPCNSYEDFYKLNDYCSTFVTGSDQVFCDLIMKTHSKGLSEYIYLLDFVKTSKRKISYAPSFGINYWDGDAYSTTMFKYFISQFNALSVREDDGKDILKNIFGVDSTQLIDGAFHIPKSTLEDMVKPYKYDGKYLAYFTLPYFKKSANIDKIVNKIAQHLGVSVKKVVFDKRMPVEEWLSIIKNAEFVISDSYHAVVFSIIFNIPFLQIINAASQSRFESLFRLLELKDNSLRANSLDFDMDAVLVNRDWNNVNSIIEREVIRAREWMKDAVSSSVVESLDKDAQNMLISKQTVLNRKVSARDKVRVYWTYNFYKLLAILAKRPKRAYYKAKRNSYKKLLSSIKSV